MAKFGLFIGASIDPIRVYEGDYMDQDGSFVKIFNYDTSASGTSDQVVAINLDKNQSVKKL